MNKEQLTEYIENNARIDAIPAEHLAGLWLQENHTVKPHELKLDIITIWAEEVDGNGYYYADTEEEFAHRIYNETATEEEEEFLDKYDNFINWQYVWDRQLRHDWIVYQVPDGQKLFVMNW